MGCLYLGRGRSGGWIPPGRDSGAAGVAERPASPLRWRGTCGDGARAPKVPLLRLASLGEHGAPGAGADPAELAGGEQQPAGAWHSVICQVRVARAPRGARGGSLHRERVPGGWPAASTMGHLQMCARGQRRRWRSPFCSSPGSGLVWCPAPHTDSQPGRPGRAGSSPRSYTRASRRQPRVAPPPRLCASCVCSLGGDSRGADCCQEEETGRSQGPRGEGVGCLAGGARVWTPGECVSSNEPKERTRLDRELPGKGWQMPNSHYWERAMGVHSPERDGGDQSSTSAGGSLRNSSAVTKEARVPFSMVFQDPWLPKPAQNF